MFRAKRSQKAPASYFWQPAVSYGSKVYTFLCGAYVTRLSQAQEIIAGRWKTSGQIINFYRINSCTGEKFVFQDISLAVSHICFQCKGRPCIHCMPDKWRRRRVERRNSNVLLGISVPLIIVILFKLRIRWKF